MYHGDRARYHYFQCLQLVLRCQIKSLIELWKLPPEFEVRPHSPVRRIIINSSQTVCRDTWALHLSTLPHVISSESLLNTEDGESEPSPPIKHLPRREPAHSNGSRDLKSEGSDSESIDSSSSEEEEDPELEALLEHLSASSGEDDSDQPPAPIEHTHPVRKARGVHELPANNIAVLILACWTLRIPVTFRDFTK